MPKLSSCARPVVNCPTMWCRTLPPSHHQRAPRQMTPSSMASSPPSGQLTNMLCCFCFYVFPQIKLFSLIQIDFVIWLFIRSVNSGQSAVCAFRLGDIKATFSRNYKVLNRDTLRWSTRVQEKIANPGEVHVFPCVGVITGIRKIIIPFYV